MLIFAAQAQLENKNAEAESLKATISQAEAAMMQFSEQSQAVQDQLVEEGKRKMAKLKDQQKKKIVQLKAEHCNIIEGVYTRSVAALPISTFFHDWFVPVWSKWSTARRRTRQVWSSINSGVLLTKQNKP
jgi:hypothetical protein